VNRRRSLCGGGFFAPADRMRRPESRLRPHVVARLQERSAALLLTVEVRMKYSIAPLFCRPWTLNAISPRLIESHYEHNYGETVRRLSALSAEIDGAESAGLTGEAIHRLKRDELSLLNSSLLHELYFASLGGDGRVVPEPVTRALSDSFGSVDRWRSQFIRLAESLAGRSGWVLLCHVPRDKRLVNQISLDHEQCIAGAIPILALDMYEHAYQLDFGTNATAYVAAFMRNIDWAAVQARLEDALSVRPARPLDQPQFADIPAVTPEGVKEMLDAGTRVQVIDVRPRHYA